MPVANSQHAVNHTVSGVRVRSKIVPAVTELRALHTLGVAPDVRPPKQRTVAEAPVRPENLRATFEYHDEQGRFLFAVDRYEAAGCRKAIRQWRLDEAGRRVHSLQGVRPVPFRLPELLQAETVFIVEGEPKVLALVAWGLAATCNPMGAGKWRSEYNAYFHDKQVVILPDHDKPGRHHAQRIAQALRPVAASVKVVELPGLPPKGDIVDWQAAGHDRDELLRLVEVAAAFDRATNGEGGEPATEDAIALQFAQKHKDTLRYCHDTGAWFVWAGTHWRREKTRLAFAWARELCRKAAASVEHKKVAATLSKAATAAAVERFAQADRAFAVTSEVWDADRYLLGTPAGVVDLRDGTLRPARREDALTKRVSVARAGTASWTRSRKVTPPSRASCGKWPGMPSPATSPNTPCSSSTAPGATASRCSSTP